VNRQPGGVDSSSQAGGLGLDIKIDRAAEIPIGVQLAWALRSRIRDGQLQPGQRLPGLRDVAEATRVNVNTVRAVYQRLEQAGLIDSQQGSGTFVAATPPRPSAVASIAADAAREAHETGVDPREVAAALYVSPARPGAPYRPGRAGAPGGDAAERRRMLREQIAALERTLGELEAKHPGVAPASARGRAGIGPTLLSVAELEEVRAGLVRRMAAVQAAIDELGSEERAPAPSTAPATRAKRARAEQPKAAAPASKPTGRRRPRTRPAPAGA
jgi:DNA-binding transcriptional regulator YhcF (GntR family)